VSAGYLLGELPEPLELQPQICEFRSTSIAHHTGHSQVHAKHQSPGHPGDEVSLKLTQWLGVLAHPDILGGGPAFWLGTKASLSM